MIWIVSDHEENDVGDVQITRSEWKEVDGVGAWEQTSQGVYQLYENPEKVMNVINDQRSITTSKYYNEIC